MIGRVKKWLGIEGVKVELLTPDTLQRDGNMLYGKLRFGSMHAQTVTSFKVVMIEKYSRGREEDRLSDEYELGELTVEETVDIPAGGTVEVPFRLPYRVTDSEMDELQNRNFLTGWAVKALKAYEKVSSEYRIEAEAKVAGVALSPFDRKEIELV